MKHLIVIVSTLASWLVAIIFVNLSVAVASCFFPNPLNDMLYGLKISCYHFFLLPAIFLIFNLSYQFIGNFKIKIAVMALIYLVFILYYWIVDLDYRPYRASLYLAVSTLMCFVDILLIERVRRIKVINRCNEKPTITRIIWIYISGFAAYALIIAACIAIILCSNS